MRIKQTLCLLMLCLSPAIHSKELVIGVEDIDYYPLWAQRSGEYSGFARELFDRFARASGHHIEYRPLPIKRLYSEFLNGRVDFKFPDNPNWATDQKQGKPLIYSQPVINYIDGVVVKNGSDKPLHTLGTVRGFTPWTYMEDIDANKIKVVENSDIDGLFKMIDAERVDGGYFNILVARYYLKNILFKPDEFIFNRNLPFSEDTYYLSTFKHRDVLEEFNRFLQGHAELLKALKQKYDIEL